MARRGVAVDAMRVVEAGDSVRMCWPLLHVTWSVMACVFLFLLRVFLVPTTRGWVTLSVSNCLPTSVYFSLKPNHNN